MKAAHILRPPGLVVFAVVVLLIVAVWWLFADRLVERSVEATGTSLVGALVELESADLRVGSGSVRLSGLQVTNPDAPMSNLMEAEELSVDLLLEPLLEKKVVVQSLVVTGVRFNTPRETSGALDDPPEGTGALWRQIDAWAERIDVPELSFEALTGTVRTEAMSADSLRTVQYAREVAQRADSMRGAWEERLTSLDPRPRIDSLRAVAERLEAFRVTPANAAQLPGLVQDGQRALADLTSLQTEVQALDESVRAGVASIGLGPDVLAELRAADLAYARSLLNVPSLDAPTLSPALFGGTAMAWLKPILFWARTAERYLPPGLDPRRRPGPQRARAEGTTVEFPGRAEYPSFWLQQGELGLTLGGTGLAAGTYTALVGGLSTVPALTGEPVTIRLDRSEASQGPTGLSLAAVLDHTSDVVRDSVGLSLSGVDLPRVDLAPLGAALDLGNGEGTFQLRRVGEDIAARLDWATDQLAWDIPAGDAQRYAQAAIGTADWARSIVWSTLEGISRVEISMSLSGNIDSPSVSIESNLGSAVAESLRRELGSQIEEAEARLRAEVEERIQPLLGEARARVQGVQDEVAGRVAEQRAEIDELRESLEARLAELTSGLPGGLPGGLPRIPGLGN
ncbi:MAG: TIGR03545 family protein [Gemmatimonadales bacterium]